MSDAKILPFPVRTNSSEDVPLHEGKVIPFPVPEVAQDAVPSCYDCRWFAIGPTGSHCVLFSEPILDEITEADECEAFEPC